MKNFAHIFLLILILSAISACEKKSCKNIVCATYQTCGNGQCYCPSGYEGDTCSVLSSKKYLGGWTVTENCPDGPSGLATYYSVSIDTDVNYPVNYIAISNFLNTGTFYAEIINNGPTNEGTYLYIPPQNSVNGLVQVSASSGNYYPSTTPGGTASIVITLNYTYQGNSNQCIETFRK